MALQALPINGGTSAVQGGEPGRKFGELLIEERLVTREQLDEALRIQGTLRTYVPIGQILTIGRTLARYPSRGPSPAPPFQTVRARFGHTAYR